MLTFPRLYLPFAYDQEMMAFLGEWIEDWALQLSPRCQNTSARDLFLSFEG